METCDNQQPWLSDDEFLQKNWILKKNFVVVLTRIEGNPVFNVGDKKQATPAYQLMVFFKYEGTEGNGASNSNQHSTFAIGYGTAALYRQRVTKALRSLSSEYIRWPNAKEMVKIGREIQRLYNFPHCVLIAHGTHFPLAFEPQTADAPDYSGRKEVRMLPFHNDCL